MGKGLHFSFCCADSDAKNAIYMAEPEDGSLCEESLFHFPDG